MSIKQKVMNIVAAHPKLVTLGIGLAVTFGIAMIVGIAETQQAHATVIVTIGKPEIICHGPCH
jgi:hypothetical protein